MKNMIALTGIGYDIHRFAEIPRPLMLGGVHIPSSRGLDGHSDADVLCHAIADALLGAAGLPDIGYWFPPGDPACKDIPSLDIVAKAVSLIRERGGRIVNVDSSLIAESPRISPYLEQMKGALGTALGISPVRVGIKATTNEQLGALGRREGIAAFAVAAILMPEDLAMPKANAPVPFLEAFFQKRKPVRGFKQGICFRNNGQVEMALFWGAFSKQF